MTDPKPVDALRELQEASLGWSEGKREIVEAAVAALEKERALCTCDMTPGWRDQFVALRAEVRRAEGDLRELGRAAFREDIQGAAALITLADALRRAVEGE